MYDTWGNTIHIYDADGDEITSTANLAVQNPIRYRGYYFDSETGLYYLQSRYYDPITCRFINADSYVSTGTGILGYNMFAYCNNSPVCLIDDKGMRPISSTSVQSETAEDRKISCNHMTSNKTQIATSSNLSNSSDLNNIFVSVYDYIYDFCDVLINSVEIITGVGVGYGGSVDAGDAGFEGFLYFNPMNISYSANSTKTYSSFYFGGNIEFLGLEMGPEIHLILDWTTMSFVNVSEEFYRISEIDFGGAYYKGFGGIGKIVLK